MTTLRGWQTQEPKLRWGEEPASIERTWARKLARDVFLRLGGRYEDAEKGIVPDFQPSDLAGFLAAAAVELLPDRNSLAKAMPVGAEAIALKAIAERYHAAHPGNYGQVPVEQARREAQQDKRQDAVEIAPVLIELRRHGPTTAATASTLLHNCRRAHPPATPADVVAVIRMVAAGFRKEIQNPVGLLIQTVPGHFVHYQPPEIVLELSGYPDMPARVFLEEVIHPLDPEVSDRDKALALDEFLRHARNEQTAEWIRARLRELEADKAAGGGE